MGELMAGQGQDEDAVRHYQSALRRDGEFVPAMIALADAFVRLSEGRVEADARRIYARALQLEPGALRAGFMIGLADWQAGRTEQAEAVWDDMLETIEPGSSQDTMFRAWISAARDQGSMAE
jgi:cytochrome c-type biogenesis protein CcmH